MLVLYRGKVNAASLQLEAPARACLTLPIRLSASDSTNDAEIDELPTRSFTLISVSKRTFQIAAALVVLFGTLTPLANAFDTWDKGAAAAPANDTELHLTAWVVGAGFVLVMTKLMRYVPAFMSGVKRIDCLRRVPAISSPVCTDCSEPTGSPPLVALRI